MSSKSCRWAHGPNPLDVLLLWLFRLYSGVARVSGGSDLRVHCFLAGRVNACCGVQAAKALKGVKTQRITFTEVTSRAVQDALAAPRTVSQALVDAYLARRALDYLFGFTLSPLLWRKLPGSRSAGTCSLPPPLCHGSQWYVAVDVCVL